MHELPGQQRRSVISKMTICNIKNNENGASAPFVIHKSISFSVLIPQSGYHNRFYCMQSVFRFVENH